MDAAALHHKHASSKSATSIPARAFLRSRYAHDERTVRDRIAVQMAQLEQRALRFGVPPKCSVLSNEHLAIVQSALHGHLEILPTHVLERMIAIESSTNATIAREWVPREKTRQLALAQLKLEHDARSQRNQDLVKQAMSAFAAGDGASNDVVSPTDEGSSSHVASVIAATGPQPRDEDARSQRSDSDLPVALPSLDIAQETAPTLSSASDEQVAVRDRVGESAVSDTHGASLLPANGVSDGSSESSRVDAAESDATASVRSPDVAAAEDDEAFEQETAASAPPDDDTSEDKSADAVSSDHRVENQAAKPRGMTVVTVSPKASPTKEASATHELSSTSALPLEDHTTAQTPLSAEVASEALETALQATEINDEEEAKEEGQEEDSADTAMSSLSVPLTHSTSHDEDSRHQSSEPETTEGVALASVAFKAVDDDDDDDDLEVLHIESMSDMRRETAATPDDTSDTTRAVASYDASVENRQIDEREDEDDRAAHETASSYPRMLRSVQSSEFSASIAASSDVSFRTSIPSLGASSSDDVRASDALEERRQSRDSGTARSVESSVGQLPVPHRHFDDSDDDADESAMIPDLLSDGTSAM